MPVSLFTGSTVASKRIIYTASDFAKFNLIFLQETGELTAQKPHISKREGLNSYLFLMVENGSGSITYGGETYSLRAGDCAFIDCRLPYSHQSSMELWTLKWVHFYGNSVKGIYDKYVERGGQCCFKTSHPEKFQTVLTALYDIASSESYIKDMELNEKLNALLTLLMAESWHPDVQGMGTRKKKDLQELRAYLDEHYQERITLDDLSEIFYINKFYLTRIFKEQFGVSINNYLLQVRITHAKQQLRFSDMPIEKVASEIGVEDVRYFTRMFKKVEGMTPGEYRKRW
ncbi:MAG: AraC family transcriptional regulator [Lachnospiraceae bacterium]|nr:AraC family transcriptional regulator [Lachnospiraceae bacterium]